ncbi:hypothetical protein AB0K51_25635 [Kitasatospora sp. NPDC049285]|uniref:hypothetical protein n=1 Tax=Kitasatospora sp. NPDC049285 TaxID=3157096 RepID=UPI00341AE21F
MWQPGDVWQVLSGGEVVGEIAVDEGDWPWLSGHFTSKPGFDALRPLFERELALAEAEDWDAWEPVVEEISRNVQLASPKGPVTEFLLHVDGESAWFRY